MTETRADKPVHIFLAILGCNVLFAVMNAFVKLASDIHPIPQIMFFRNFFAMIPLLFLIMHAGGLKLLKTDRPGVHFLRSFVGTAGMILYFTSFSMLPLANAVAVTSTTPLILTLLAIPLLGERVGWHRLAAIAVGLGAVVFMVDPFAASNIHVRGNLIALAAATVGAFVLIIIRRMGRTEHPLTIAFYFTLFASLATAFILPFYWVTPTPQSFVWLLLAGLFGGGAQALMTWAYANGPAAYVSALSYSSLLFAALLDWAIWNHIIEPRIAIGSGIIIATGLYVLHRETKKKRPVIVEPLS